MKPVRAGVFVNTNDSRGLDKAIRALNNQVKESGLMQEVREREYYLKPSVKKRMKRRKNRNLNN
jgi:small subunit ribosomal protein S21